MEDAPFSKNGGNTRAGSSPAPGTVSTSLGAGGVFAAVGVCLRMAVRAQEANVLEAVIVANTVAVVEMESEQAAAPLRDSTTGADVGHDAFIDEPPLQLAAIGVCAALDKDLG